MNAVQNYFVCVTKSKYGNFIVENNLVNENLEWIKFVVVDLGTVISREWETYLCEPVKCNRCLNLNSGNERIDENTAPLQPSPIHLRAQRA